MASDRYLALLVDDEEAIQKLAARALRKQGFDCDFAADGDQAAQMAAKSRYDVIVTDLKMPNRHGHAFAVELLQQEDRPLVVVCTGITEPRLANDLLTRGVDDIYFKPIDYSLFAAKVTAMVERRSPSTKESSGAVGQTQQAPNYSSCEEDPAIGPINLCGLNQKIAELSTVLSVSDAALDVYEMTRSYDWQVSQIAAAIQRDASLTAEVLRLANSSLYNLSGQRLVNLEAAVLRIGQKRVGELALSASALSALAPGMLPWMDLELTWERSMAAGIVVESLIEAGGHQKIEEGLLLSAIMHPLGRVALGMLFPKHYEAMIKCCNQEGTSLQEQERQTFPTSHAEVLAHLLATWRIPPNVFLPLKFSLDGFSALAQFSKPARTKTELVKLAIVLGRLAVGRWESWDLLQFPSPRILKRLGVKNVAQIIQQARSDLSKLAEFRPGGQTSTSKAAPTTAKQKVAYCNISGDSDDLLVELLPSIGLEPSACSVEEARRAETGCILNCMGATSARVENRDGWKNTVIVTDEESADAFARFAPTVALPNSYARFRNTALGVIRGKTAGSPNGIAPSDASASATSHPAAHQTTRQQI